MSNFMEFKTAVQEQFKKMSEHNMFVTGIDKDKLWSLYLDSFPEGTNRVLRERREYDCQCCKQFIKTCGNVVAVVDNKLLSIWDIKCQDDTFNVVSKEVSKFVKSKPIIAPFFHYENTAGTDFNHQLTDKNETLKWEHFFLKLPSSVVKHKDTIGSLISEFKSVKDVFKRGLDEITFDAIETVQELIDQDSIYRGAEFKSIVDEFLKYKRRYNGLSFKTHKDNFSWNESLKNVSVARTRNTVIGTLLVDLSNNVPLNDSVKMFESKVAPAGYKRPKALITKSMIKNAQKKVQELGIEDSLHRRFAIESDLTINNVLFADRDTQISMNVFDDLIKETPDKMKNLDKIEEISIKDFIGKVLPKSNKIELLLDNRHENNLMSLIAPKITDSREIFKWNNNFSWAYNGEVADSVRERVVKAGGRVDGVFRFSHSWNEIEPNQSLMDLHVFMPGNSHYNDKSSNRYGNNQRVGWNRRNHLASGGSQDVDYTSEAPVGYIPVENITFPDINKMKDGKYICKIHNWKYRGTGGRGKAEIEFGGNVYRYVYPQTKHKEWVTVAEVTLKNGEFSIEHSLKESEESKEVWGVTTNKLHKVKMIMNSPNHWDGNNTGNKHWFFILEDCKNPEEARGFFNEYLKRDLRDHRKVFEVLAGKMKCEESRDQLSGLGFSSTQRNEVICKVTGNFTRMLKIKF